MSHLWPLDFGKSITRLRLMPFRALLRATNTKSSFPASASTTTTSLKCSKRVAFFIEMYVMGHFSLPTSLSVPFMPNLCRSSTPVRPLQPLQKLQMPLIAKTNSQQTSPHPTEAQIGWDWRFIRHLQTMPLRRCQKRRWPRIRSCARRRGSQSSTSTSSGTISGCNGRGFCRARQAGAGNRKAMGEGNGYDVMTDVHRYQILNFDREENERGSVWRTNDGLAGIRKKNNNGECVCA